MELVLGFVCCVGLFMAMFALAMVARMFGGGRYHSRGYHQKRWTGGYKPSYGGGGGWGMKSGYAKKSFEKKSFGGGFKGGGKMQKW